MKKDHPLVYYFDDIEVGDSWASSARTITETDVVMFAALTGDFNQLHVDHEFAKSTVFGKPIAHGLLGISIAAGLGSHAPFMKTVAFVAIREWAFLKPIFFGDTLRVRTEVIEKSVRGRGRRGLVLWKKQVLNQEGTVVQEGVLETLVEVRSSKPSAT